MKLNVKKIENNCKNTKVFWFNKIDSTNNIAKKLAIDGTNEGTIVIAEQQTSGRGRLGRTFVSKKGGVYFSIVLKPKNKPENILFITVAAAVAVARAIEHVTNKKCDIKWVNDIFLNNKKVSGILTEGGFGENGVLEYAILGVGINLFEPKSGFDKDLPLAGSVINKKYNIFKKNRIKEEVIINFVNTFFNFYNNLEQKEFLSEYKEKSFLTGKEIYFIKDEKKYVGKVIGINNDANLIVEVDKKEQILSYGEIQIVGMEQLAI